ncbi:MAG: D-glycero-beta-D-manno-heptose-7-phosphate kinase [Acidobacteria bacterium]|nr:D-glycero-beta-D-manno-heptose-7-phosphate kinase [Acidobacteriota bacterium]
MRLEKARAAQLLQDLKGAPVLVLGDLMLDEYLFGEVNRISPEAPVPIVRVLRETAVLGGAANVAANLKALGAEPILVGTLRQDAAGERILSLLGRLGIRRDGAVLDPDRPTIIKTRVVGQQQQMLRIDREEPGSLSGSAISGLCARLDAMLGEAKAVVVSDYAKGVIGPKVMADLRARCKAKGLPWIVDPKPAHKALYEGATLMTPNRKELEALSGLAAGSDAEVAAAGARLREALSLKGLLVTRSEKGMALLAPEEGHREPWMIPTEAREVFDVSGAGDTVVAAFAASVASGADWREAAMLANAAAGVVVAKVGTATVTPDELLAHYHAQEAN